MTECKDVRMRGATTIEVPENEASGSIHPFFLSKRHLLQGASRELACVLSDTQSKKILSLGALNITCTIVLLFWCNSTNSMALTAYTYLTIFDIFCLLSCLVSIWVQQQKSSPVFSFGFERFEVLAVFASTILAQFGSLFIVKESIERMVVQPEIHTGRLLMGTTLAFCYHILLTYTIDNRTLNHVIVASSSSWLQEHVSDISESICNVIPGISKLLLPRINPFALIAFAGATALLFVYLLIDIRNFYSADTWAAVWIALMTCGTMFPMSVYSGKILLQTTPSHIIGQLDKSIREASTLDGVLEFRHEHFWNLTFGTMVGSVHVRIRRDADEQLVLAHVYNRLSNLVSVLTVQVFKDDWSRPSSLNFLNNLSGTFSTNKAGVSGRATSPTSPPYGALSASQASPYGPSPALIPTRTDPAVVASFSASATGNIPALRLANQTPSVQPPPMWNKVSSPLERISHSAADPRKGIVTNSNNGAVISVGDLANNYLGSGLSIGPPQPASNVLYSLPSLQPSSQRPEPVGNTQKNYIGKQT